MAKRPVPLYDFKAFGAAIKAARNEYGESRKKVSDELYISPRYLANIENKGQHPSLQIFFELIQRYHISVDQFLLETPPEKNTQRRQLDALLDGMSDTGIRIVTASKKRPSKLPEEWEVIPDTHEGIVTQEEFDTVQQLMTSRRREQNAGGFEISLRALSSVRTAAMRCGRRVPTGGNAPTSSTAYNTPAIIMADMAMLCVPHTALKRGTYSMPSLPTSTALRIWRSMMKRRSEP